MGSIEVLFSGCENKNIYVFSYIYNFMEEKLWQASLFFSPSMYVLSFIFLY